MKKVICIFCGEKKEKAKEHIWPKWLQIYIEGSTKSHFQGTHLGMGVFPKSQRTSSGEKLVLGNVCKDCNNGWMESLENKFKYIINKILPISIFNGISNSDCEILAKWAYKTACVINRGSNFYNIIPERHIRKFYKYKSIPENVIVEIGFLDPRTDKTLTWLQGKMQFILKPNNYKGDVYSDTAQSYLLSMQIYSLLIRVAYWPLSIDHFSHNVEEGSLFRIWPYSNDINQDNLIFFDDIHSFTHSLFIKMV